MPDTSSKKEGNVKAEATEVISLDDEDDAGAVANTERAIVGTAQKKKSKQELKQEIKSELAERQKRKERKAAKVKREKGGDDAVERRGAGKDKDRGEDRGRSRGRSRSKGRGRAESSSSSSESSSSSISDMYRKFKPYTKVVLRNLVRKADLNGMTGMVVHPAVSVCPCPPGCILVRLDTGREIGVKPTNLAPLQTFHRGPQLAGLNQEARLKQVLTQIKLNMDNVMDRTSDIRDASGAILDDAGAVQGGIGHVI